MMNLSNGPQCPPPLVFRNFVDMVHFQSHLTELKGEVEIFLIKKIKKRKRKILDTLRIQFKLIPEYFFFFTLLKKTHSNTSIDIANNNWKNKCKILVTNKFLLNQTVYAQLRLTLL